MLKKIKKCQNCQLEFQKNNRQKYCSESCKKIAFSNYLKDRSEKIKSGIIKIRPHSAERKLKRSLSQKNKWKDDAYRQMMRKSHSHPLTEEWKSNIKKGYEAVKDRISEKISQKYKNDPEYRNRVSLGVCKSIKEGNSNSFSKCKQGYYDSIKGNKKTNRIYYRSSYELKAFQILDADEKVKKWFYEKIIVPLPSGKNTVVDLEVHFHDGSTKIIEIKPERMLNFSNNQEKFKHIELFANKNNSIFEIWTENKLELKNENTEK